MTAETKPLIIDNLTAEQEALLKATRDKYVPIAWARGVQTNPEETERAVKELYARQKLPLPEFRWYDSPFAAAVDIQDSTGTYPGFSGIDGHFDACWVAVHKFCSACGVPYNQTDLDGLALWDVICQSSGPIWPFSKMCLCSVVADFIKCNERMRVHCDDGPAMLWRDGTKLYWFDGVPVPEKVIMEPWNLTREEINSASANVDLQTVMIRRWCYAEKNGAGDRRGEGGGRWLEETGATVVHMDVFTPGYRADGKHRQIQRALLRDRQGNAFLMCCDGSTDAVYHVSVSPEAKTCEEAHMSVNGGKPDSKIRVMS